MKLATKLLILSALFGGFGIIGCGPQADPQNASGENEAFDEDAYAKQMEEEAKKSAAEIGQE